MEVLYGIFIVSRVEGLAGSTETKLAREIYKSTADFPKHEVYGLSQQMRRAAVSVPSNIAEGKGHRSTKSLRISYSTLADHFWSCKLNC